jgi:hypothetical protein
MSATDLTNEAAQAYRDGKFEIALDFYSKAL